MKKKVGLGAVLAVLVFAFLLSGCGEEQPSSSPIPTTTTTTATTVATTTMLYEKDETINAFLVCYNDANPNTPISMNDFSVYNHHGRDHDDQIRGWIDGIEVVISQSYFGKNMEIEVCLDGSNTTTTEEYKTLFKRFANAFCKGTTDEQLNDYWDSALNDNTNRIENEFFECDLTVYDEEVEFIVIEG